MNLYGRSPVILFTPAGAAVPGRVKTLRNPTAESRSEGMENIIREGRKERKKVDQSDVVHRRA